MKTKIAIVSGILFAAILFTGITSSFMFPGLTCPAGTIVKNDVCVIAISEDTTQQTELIIESTPDSLPSWNNGDSKQKIIEFVNKVTNPSSSAFVPIEDRIATFDNDGTLWIEQPLYIPFFISSRVSL